VQVFSDPYLAVQRGNIIVQFNEIAFSEFPIESHRLSITPAPSTFGIMPPKVSESRKGEKKIYKIVRFGLRRSKEQGEIIKRYDAEPPQVVQATEEVKGNGNYINSLTDIPTPGLTIKPKHFQR